LLPNVPAREGGGRREGLPLPFQANAAAGTYDEKLGHGFFSTHICSRPSVDRQVVLVAPSR
jgi:hypothetical protein